MNTANLLENVMPKKQIDEATALASFGIRKFHSKKFENTDGDILVRTPLESKGISNAMSALHAAIPDVFSIEDLSPPSEEKDRMS
jgi:hypothetical protein